MRPTRPPFCRQLRDVPRRASLGWPPPHVSATPALPVGETSQDPHLVLTALGRQAPKLEIGTLDMCFLAALHLRSRGEALTAFSEAELFHAFDDVCSLIEPAADNRKRRATHAIQRLREQRLLSRVDGRGIVERGEYALTRLATGIVEFHLDEEALTRESLTLLTRTLIGNLGDVQRAAAAATSPGEWQARVVGPLRVTIADLVGGIERRQRGLDLQQEELQRRIGTLLHSDWFGALERCQELLESTAATLRELNEILLRDSHELQGVLQDIQDTSSAAGEQDAEEAARRMSEQVDRITSWGGARQRAWSEFYEYVHHFLRDVVRLDPTRALTQRLREQLRGKRAPRFSLTVAHAPPMRVLRTVIALLDPPPVKRPREQQREKPPVEVEPHDPGAELEAAVAEILGRGVTALSAITEALTASLPREERFVVAGRIAQIVARATQPDAARERPWTPVGSDIEIEEWRLSPASNEGAVS